QRTDLIDKSTSNNELREKFQFYIDKAIDKLEETAKVIDAVEARTNTIDMWKVRFIFISIALNAFGFFFSILAIIFRS
ncbi:MAG: hypothetical protein ABFD59_06765, partial [Smithella sp.]